MNNLKLDQVKNLYFDKKRSVKETAAQLGISIWSLYTFMDKHNISRRSPSEATYVVNKDKPQFKIKEELSIAEEKLKIAGIMLYWAEGTSKGCTVDFANSNPEMIKIFLRFLREICGVDERRLRVYLYAHSHKDIKRIKEYWHHITKIQLEQFTKPYIREGNTNISNRKMLYGLIHIRYNDKRLLEKIRSWIEGYIENNSVLRTGGGAANRTRL